MKSTIGPEQANQAGHTRCCGLPRHVRQAERGPALHIQRISAAKPYAVEISADEEPGVTCDLTQVATCGEAQLMLIGWLQFYTPHCGSLLPQSSEGSSETTETTEMAARHRCITADPSPDAGPSEFLSRV